MDINDKFPSTYIKAIDLKDKAILVAIERVEEDEIGGEDKAVVYFHNQKKGLVLNKTNAQMIQSKYGAETDNWRDCEVELYPDKTNYQGQLVDCLRVRIPVPRASSQPEEDLF